MFGRTKNAVDVVTAKTMSDDDGYIIVDVRTPKEWNAGHVPGSIHVSLDTLHNRLPGLEGKQVLAICQTGSRSKSATSFLNRSGIEAINVTGGLVAWQRAGLPIKRGN